MVYDLTIGERFALAAALPQEGNFLALRTAATLRDKLLPTEAETTEFGIEPVGDGGLRWRADAGDIRVGIEVTNAETAAVIDLLRKMDAAEQLTAAHVPLYELFVEG